jgi:hypothetical protein
MTGEVRRIECRNFPISCLFLLSKIRLPVV